MNLLQPFIDARHMILVVARKDSYFVTVFVIGKANVASNQAFVNNPKLETKQEYLVNEKKEPTAQFHPLH